MDARPTIEQRQFWRAGPFLGRNGRCDHALGARCGSTVERCLAVGAFLRSRVPVLISGRRAGRARAGRRRLDALLAARRAPPARARPDRPCRAPGVRAATSARLARPLSRPGPDRDASRRLRRRDRRRRAVCAGREQAGVLWRLRPRGPRDPRRGRRGCGGAGRPMPRRRGRSRSRRPHAGDRPAPCVLRRPAPARDSHRTGAGCGAIRCSQRPARCFATRPPSGR